MAAEEASGATAELYGAEEEAFGFLPNFVRAFSHRPEVYSAWKQLNGAVKGGMDLRRYELATLAAARELRSSYCALAHGSVLIDKGFLEPDALLAVVSGHRSAALDEVDCAVIDLAAKVADDATAVEQADVDRLRALGLSDRDILNVVLAAAVRCFFSKVLDAVGAGPDQEYARLDPALRDALAVGRAVPAA
ncbi:MAG TPA: carboxymuconolactone decarboxylase family protein [Solirubrobacteraceae bacterium]|nr:carboxymuconolactone decarboxylase family protein [Solirubrobacteraceae bacterium]